MDGVKILCPTCGGIRSDRFEDSFKQLLSQSSQLFNVLTTPKKELPSKVPYLESRIKELQKQQRRLTEQSVDESLPTNILKEKLRELKIEEDACVNDIENENTRLFLNKVSTNEVMKEYTELYANGWNDNDKRLRIRDLLKTIIEELVVDINNHSYSVKFKDVRNPIDVKLDSKTFTINGIMTLNYSDGLCYKAKNINYLKRIKRTQLT